LRTLVFYDNRELPVKPPGGYGERMASRPSVTRIARRFPGTLALAALTLAMFAVEWAVGGTTDLPTEIRLGAMRADRVVDQFEVWRLIMPMFLHHGLLHLALNGLAFLQLGALVEELWGGRRMVLFYVVSGIAASMCSAAFNPGYMGAVGASGAILGLAGVLLGGSLYGAEPMRELLADVRPRLRRAVLFTLLIGGLLWFSGLVPIDNAAHLGGLFTGFLLAAAYPMGRRGRFGLEGSDEGATAGAIVAGGLVLAAFVLTALQGGRAVETLDADTARLMSEQISRSPGTMGTTGLLIEALDHYEAAGQYDQGVDVFERAVRQFDQPMLLQVLVGTLMQQSDDEGVNRDRPVRAALDRWLELEPQNSDALNALAWHLVTAKDPANRDPVRAEALSRESLARLGDASTDAVREQRASFLDTLAESLFLQGKIHELSARLDKIRKAAG
jgi:membrane associated rhomboid family serine protease